MKKTIIFVWLVLLLVFTWTTSHAEEMTSMDPVLQRSIYADEETLRFSVSWLGIKGGELLIQLKRVGDAGNTFRIDVTAKSAGLLGVFYPIEDRFQTMLQGGSFLPSRYLLEQHEGKRQNRKETLYDQQNYVLQYKKNEEPEKIYELDGPVHNEFSSFFYMRALSFSERIEAYVPTFADQKRHNIRVTLEAREPMQSILGERSCIKVIPHLTFKGLYEKMGDPVIWLTDDIFRIPLRIQAKILIGSLTADLVEYQGVSPDHGQDKR